MNIADWHARAPELVSLIGQDGFAAELGRALGMLAPFDLSCAFGYPGQDRPLLLHDGLGGISPPAIMENYLSGTYLLDAVYSACQRGVPKGLYRLSELAPDAFFEGDYFRSPHVHPCISMESGALAEEIVFIAPVGPAAHVAYSLMRQHGHPGFDDGEMDLLHQAAPMVAALMLRHWQSALRSDDGDSRVGTDRPAAIEQTFRRFRPSQLTAREQTIVSLILRGHSSLSIGKLLRIAEGTVKIHRKHIYSKLGISSQTELFNLFIAHLMDAHS